jgi:hypothetical protein
MPDPATQRRVRRDQFQDKAPSTQAGEFVREEFAHAREGNHPVKSPRQAVAIGLAKARRAGIPVKPRKGGAPPGGRRPAARVSKPARTGGGSGRQSHANGTSRQGAGSNRAARPSARRTNRSRNPSRSRPPARP